MEEYDSNRVQGCWFLTKLFFEHEWDEKVLKLYELEEVFELSTSSPPNEHVSLLIKTLTNKDSNNKNFKVTIEKLH